MAERRNGESNMNMDCMSVERAVYAGAARGHGTVSGGAY